MSALEINPESGAVTPEQISPEAQEIVRLVLGQIDLLKRGKRQRVPLFTYNYKAESRTEQFFIDGQPTSQSIANEAWQQIQKYLEQVEKVDFDSPIYSKLTHPDFYKEKDFARYATTQPNIVVEIEYIGPLEEDGAYTTKKIQMRRLTRRERFMRAITTRKQPLPETNKW